MPNILNFDVNIDQCSKIDNMKEEQNMAKKLNVIRQFTADNVPNAIANHVKVVASDILVVPLDIFENIIKILVAKNLPYQTYTRKNDIIIAVLLKGV